MDLFNQFIDKRVNYLPKDGEVNYYGSILTQAAANLYFNSLLNSIEWKNDEAIIFGRKISTKRKVAWYGDKPFEYTYSNTKKIALPWIKDLAKLKQLVENETNETCNSCLLNLYHNGNEGMSWHSDNEADLKKEGAIASLSLGVGRKFALKHKLTKEKVEIYLENGSLLVMKGLTQKYWLHSLPQNKKIGLPRINLTFRTITE